MVGSVRMKPEVLLLILMVNAITDINVKAFNTNTAVSMTLGVQGV